MKRIVISVLLSAVLLLPGCTSEYFQRVDELQERIDALYASCDELNKNVFALQTLVSAIQTKDMITGITEILEKGVRTGYRINFVNHDPVTVMNGKDGNKPLISVEWMLDPDGNKMLSIGVLPYLAIKNGMWCYTIDGQNYVEIGKADGANADQMFASFNTSNSDYVTITLSNGEKLKIPTYAAYLSLKSDFSKVNDNTKAQAEIIKAAVDKIKATYLTRVAPILSGKDTIGTYFSLANGKSGSIYDWTSPMLPVIFAKADTDGQLYWAYSFGDQEDRWVLSPDGKKISASSDPAEAPQVDVVLGDDGNWYWTVTYKGETEILRYPVGDGYAPHAIENEKNSAFSSVTNYADSLVVVLKEGNKRYRLPKQYTVSFLDADGKAVGDTISMKLVSGGDSKRINYVAYGPSPYLTLMSEGGFTAIDRKIGSSNYIEIHAPAIFVNGTGKVTALFTFGNDGTPVSVIKTFYIKREEE